MPLTVLDVDDAQQSAATKLSKARKAFEDRFYGPLREVEQARQLAQLVGQVDPGAADRIKEIFGGKKNG